MEAYLSKSIIAWYNKQPGVFVVKATTSPLTWPMLDIIGVVYGRFFTLEVKIPGKKPTPRQQKLIETWLEKGGIASWTNSLVKSKELLLYIRDNLDVLDKERLKNGFLEGK